MGTWRLIDAGPSGAPHNMALDEAISVAVRRGESPPTLRLYGWTGPSLSVGCFQKTDGIDLSYLESKGIPLVRRPTGGRAILHGKELTYSFSSRYEGRFSGGLRECYRNIADALSLALRGVGVPASLDEARGSDYSKTPLCFGSRSYGELSSGGIKLAGSAQRRWRDGFLQQGSIPYFSDLSETARIFKLGADKSGLLKEPALPREYALIDPSLEASLKDAIRGSFERSFGIKFIRQGPTPREEALLRGLLRGKYLLPGWNLFGEWHEGLEAPE